MCVLEVGTLQQEDPEWSTSECCLVTDQTETLAGLSVCGFLTKCYCLPPVLSLLFCSTWWLALRAGSLWSQGWQDRTEHCLLWLV